MTSNLHEQEEHDTIVSLLSGGYCNARCGSNGCISADKECAITYIRKLLECEMVPAKQQVQILEDDVSFILHYMSDTRCTIPHVPKTIGCIKCAWYMGVENCPILKFREKYLNG